MSHNVFKQFDVPRTGVILNNSAQNATSAIGGTVKGNSKVQGYPASLIVNEVTSAKTKLQGKIEVLGQKAAVVIANPNGIACDGCGFVNASRVTLATAKPQFSEGTLSTLSDSRGPLSIAGSRVDVSGVDYFDLVGSNIKITAAITGNNVLISAGDNNFDYRTSTATSSQNFDGNVLVAPALETSALGGITGNNIRLIAMGKDRGVNLSGQLNGGQVTIATEGDINLGRISAGYLNAESKGKITTNDTIRTAWDASLKGNNVDIKSKITGQRNLAISANESINFLKKTSGANATDLVSLTSSKVNLGNGTVDSVKNVSIKAYKLTQEVGGSIDSGYADIEASDNLAIAGSINSDVDLTIKSRNTSSSGKLTGKTVSIYADTANVAGDISAKGNIYIESSNVDLSGKIYTPQFFGVIAKNINLRGLVDTGRGVQLWGYGTGSNFTNTGEIKGLDLAMYDADAVTLQGSVDTQGLYINGQNIILEGSINTGAGDIEINGYSIVQKANARSSTRSNIYLKASNYINVGGILSTLSGNIKIETNDRSPGLFSTIYLDGRIEAYNISIASRREFRYKAFIRANSLDISTDSAYIGGNIETLDYIKISSSRTMIEPSKILSRYGSITLNSKIIRNSGSIQAREILYKWDAEFENKGEIIGNLREGYYF